MQEIPNVVRLCQEGHLEAFTTLFDHYEHHIFDVASAILRDDAAAEDVVQDTFVTLFEKITNYKGESRFKTWLTVVTVNLCGMKLRRWRIRQALSLEQLSPRQLLGLSRRSKKLDVLIEQRQQQATLWELVDQLPDKQRLPLILRYRFALPCKDIAHILNRKTSTIYQDLHGGRRELARRMRQSETAEQVPTNQGQVELT